MRLSKKRRLYISSFVSLLIHFVFLFGSENVFVEQGTYAIANEVVSVSMELIPETPIAEASLIVAPEEIKKEIFIKPKQIKKQIAEVKKIPVVKRELKNPSIDQTRARLSSTAKSSAKIKYDVKARPDYLKNPAPAYPWDSKRNREEGVVMLTVDIDSKGNAEKVKLRKSSGYPRLDRAALESVSDWRFKPARLAGIAVESTAIIPVRFVLR